MSNLPPSTARSESPPIVPSLLLFAVVGSAVAVTLVAVVVGPQRDASRSEAALEERARATVARRTAHVLALNLERMHQVGSDRLGRVPDLPRGASPCTMVQRQARLVTAKTPATLGMAAYGAQTTSFRAPKDSLERGALDYFRRHPGRRDVEFVGRNEEGERTWVYARTEKVVASCLQCHGPGARSGSAQPWPSEYKSGDVWGIIVVSVPIRDLGETWPGARSPRIP